MAAAMRAVTGTVRSRLPLCDGSVEACGCGELHRRHLTWGYGPRVPPSCAESQRLGIAGRQYKSAAAVGW